MEWVQAYGSALGVTLSDEDADVVLQLARVVAHGTERRNAPLATFVAGQFVATQVGSGAAASTALEEALDEARRLLPQ